MGKMFTKEEVAELLQVSVATVNNMIKEKRLKFVQITSSRIRIPEEALSQIKPAKARDYSSLRESEAKTKAKKVAPKKAPKKEPEKVIPNGQVKDPAASK